MSNEEQYSRLLNKQREKEALDFLKGLSKEERTALAPHIKKLSKEYFKYEMVGNTYKNKATQAHSNILMYSAFVCYNKTDFQKENPSYILSKEHLEKILPWYVPSWFEEYINSFSELEWLPYQLDYFYMMELSDRGLLQPDPRMIARTLVPIIFERKGNDNKFVPENVAKHPATLKEHIWYFFQYETTVHYSNRYIYFNGEKKLDETGWIVVFKKYVDEGKIDRQRILKETLLASNRNFNKILSGWFAELFVQLIPTKEEVLSNQMELLVLFSSPHSKVVNTALQGLKHIVDKPLFDYNGFLDNAALPIASETKSVVSATISLLEKIARKHADARNTVCTLLAGVFIHKDEALQSRAAKLIEKNGRVEEESLVETLSSYGNTMFSKARQSLQQFLDKSGPEESLADVHVEDVPGKKIGDPLPQADNIEDLIFLASQAFDNNEAYHIDLLPAALIQLRKKIKGEDLSKFEPALQRALKLFYGDWRSNIGQLDRLLGSFFIDFVFMLMKKNPAHSQSLERFFESFMSKSELQKKEWRQYGTNLSFLAGWKVSSEDQLYEPYKKFFYMVKERLWSEVDLPLLSTPTHAPAWVDTATLVERLYQYQLVQKQPDLIDFQIALSRCWLHDTTTAAFTLAKNKLQGEMREIILFMLDKQARPQGPFTMVWAWIMAALSKCPGKEFPEFNDFGYQQLSNAKLTGQHPWQVIVEHYTIPKYRWQNNRMYTDNVPAQRTVLNLDLSAQASQQKKISGFRKFLSKLAGNNHKEQPSVPPLLYDYFHIKSHFLSIEDRDIKRLLMVVPNNPEPVLALTVHKCLRHPKFWGETEKRFTIEVLKGMHDIWKPLGEMGHLFIATCLVCSDKTAAQYAAEIWIKGVQNQNINSALIGQILGKKAIVEFTPMKRFTDLLIDRMLGVSPFHNKALEEMTVALLKCLPETPIKNLKKVLEIYFELLTTNCSEVKDIQLEKLLRVWKEKEGLKKVVRLT